MTHPLFLEKPNNLLNPQMASRAGHASTKPSCKKAALEVPCTFWIVDVANDASPFLEPHTTSQGTSAIFYSSMFRSSRWLLSTVMAAALVGASAQPNFVLMLADDMGW
jgi:hypothetical protein